MKAKALAVVSASIALFLAVQGAAIAGPQNGHGHDKDRTDDGRDWNDRNDDAHGNNPKDQGRHDNGKHKGWEKQAYRRGERLPDRYYSRTYYVTDYERYNVRRPDPGYRWVRDDDGQLIMIAIATGLIVDMALGH
jgi:Ni/Co efflux regulator RcnB